MFEGIRGNGYRGDIAVDDISVDLTSGCTTSPDFAKPQSGMSTVSQLKSYSIKVLVI